MKPSDLADALGAVGYTVMDSERLTSGANNESYRVDTTAGRFALRRAGGGLADDEALSLAAEGRLLTIAARAGVAVPRVEATISDGPLGDALLMEWIDGETLGPRIVRWDRFAAVRPGLAAQCGVQLARIHAVGVAEVAALGLARFSPRSLVEATWRHYRELHHPQPMIDYSARWLLDHAPADAPPTLVHGDFRCGNLMVDERRGLVGVLDWELAHIGNPIRDLGWLCCRSWRFGEWALPVGGFGTREELVDAYQGESGRAVDLDELTYWEVFGSFWWAVTCLGMVEAYRAGEDASIERLAIGRRTSEGQADCADLILSGPIDRSAPAEGGDPTVAELLTGVADFIGEPHLADRVGSRDGFLLRVSANSIAIAARDSELGPAARAAECRRLSDLLGHDGDLHLLRAELCEQIGDDRIDRQSPELHRHLRSTLADQLAIDQPMYPALAVE